MKCIRLVEVGKPLELHETPVPQVGPREVLIRVKAAGVCHSDAHYRAGVSPAFPLPLTLGHEVSGVIEAVGPDVQQFKKGEPVCVHYMATCGHCSYCDQGTEQFCPSGQMIGKHRNGGYAEFISVPSRSVFRLPEEIPFEVGAVMMCSSATSLHAFNKTRLRAGETVAIFGVGGLGMSALQLAQALGAGNVFAVDINPGNLQIARQFGATPINPASGDPVEQLKELTKGRGVDVAVELIGLPLTMKQAVQSLAIMGRAGLVGLTQQSFEISPYREVLNKEAEIIGVSDHLATEIPPLLEFARSGKLQFPPGVIKTVPLEAMAVNATLDNLGRFGDTVRTVIVPA